MADTIGDRVFAIRQALSPVKRKPLPFRDFAAKLSETEEAKRTGRTYDPSTPNRWEIGKVTPSFSDIAALAELDPQHRGRLWLIYGEEAEVSRVPTESDVDALRTSWVRSLLKAAHQELVDAEARGDAKAAATFRALVEDYAVLNDPTRAPERVLQEARQYVEYRRRLLEDPTLIQRALDGTLFEDVTHPTRAEGPGYAVTPIEASRFLSEDDVADAEEQAPRRRRGKGKAG